MPSVEYRGNNLDQFRSISDRKILNGSKRSADDVAKMRTYQSYKVVHSAMASTQKSEATSDILLPLESECLNKRWSSALPQEYSRS